MVVFGASDLLTAHSQTDRETDRGRDSLPPPFCLLAANSARDDGDTLHNGSMVMSSLVKSHIWSIHSCVEIGSFDQIYVLSLVWSICLGKTVDH